MQLKIVFCEIFQLETKFDLETKILFLSVEIDSSGSRVAFDKFLLRQIRTDFETRLEKGSFDWVIFRTSPREGRTSHDKCKYSSIMTQIAENSHLVKNKRLKILFDPYKLLSKSGTLELKN